MDAFSVTGLQGTGKTTLARALGRALGAVVISRDPLMDVLQAGGVPVEGDRAAGVKSFPELGYELQGSLLRSHLEAGWSVVLECVVGWQVREHWRQVTEAAGARLWLIDTVCSDPEVHRSRFEDRGPTARGDWVLTWDQVATYRIQFQPHPRADYIADAVRPVEENVAAIVDLVNSSGQLAADGFGQAQE